MVKKVMMIIIIIMDIVTNSLKVKSVKITKAIRLGGQKQDKREKPRALLVHLENEDMKRDILATAKNLRQTEKWRNTYIVPDMTRQQREENWKLRQELKSRRENGELNLMIRQGKIVKRWKRKVASDISRESTKQYEKYVQDNVNTSSPLTSRDAAEDKDIEVDGTFGAVGGATRSQ